MSCKSRKLFTTEIGRSIENALQQAAADRNDLIAKTGERNPPKIYVTHQTDDPLLPGTIKIDVDFPTEEQAIKNKYVARLEINQKTGELRFFPNGYPPAEIHPFTAHLEILERMCDTVWKH